MGKWVADQVLDGALAVISTATRMVAVNGQPESYAAAWNGRLAEIALGSADFSIGQGETSGRRIVLSAKENATVLANGTADHVALLHTGDEQLLYVTTCPPQVLGAGGAVSFEGWSVEIGAPL